MTRKKESLHVQADLSGLFSDAPKRKSVEGFSINKALQIVVRQMKASGLRERTISDYELHVEHIYSGDFRG